MHPRFVSTLNTPDGSLEDEKGNIRHGSDSWGGTVSSTTSKLAAPLRSPPLLRAALQTRSTTSEGLRGCPRDAGSSSDSIFPTRCRPAAPRSIKIRRVIYLN